MREQLELGLGESLGDVRVHADAHAGALARAVSGRAFTVGSDLFFAEGAYRPGSRDGDKLIAHEVMHAVQQRGAAGSGLLNVSAPGEATEVEAEAMATTLQAKASAHPPGEPASAGGHKSGRTAGAMRVTRRAAISVARAVDPTSDEYQRGRNDGRAGNPPAPGELSPEDYNEGYQNGQAEAGAAQASLPPATALPTSTASPPPASIAAPATAPAVDPSSDDYQRGRNDGRANNPPNPPMVLSPTGMNDYYAGYQNGQAEADAAQASLSPVPVPLQPGDVVWVGDTEYVIYEAEVRVGQPRLGRFGSSAWLDNNPGNIAFPGGGLFGSYPGKTNWHDFLIFPSYEAGLQAIRANLFSGRYRSGNMSIVAAITQWAPAADKNNPAAYAHRVAQRIGVSEQTIISQLTSDQLQGLMNGIQDVEGYNPNPGGILARDDPQLPAQVRSRL